MKSKLHLFIFVGMVAGAGVGLSLAAARAMGGGPFQDAQIWIFDLLGRTIFVGSLKMIVAPLIFFSIMAAITSLATTGELWRIGWKTLLFYLATTSIAVTIGLLLVLTIRPGHASNQEDIRRKWEENKEVFLKADEKKTEKLTKAEQRGALETIKSNLEKIIMNPFKALTESQSLGIIFFAILLAIALIAIGEKGRPVIPVICGINEAIMKLTGWIMLGSPLFIFCLIASLVGKLGATIFETLAWYVATVIIGIAIHVCVLLVICKLFGKKSPIEFLRGIRKAWMVAFSTRSSAATLPVTINCVQNNLGVSPKAARFVLPLGATVNMDGTALYEGVAIIFLIQLFGPEMTGIELTPVITVIIFLTAVLASIGAAAVPDAGLITMVLVANAVGLSADFIVIIFAVDAFLDMFRTSTNIMGDSVGAVVIDRIEVKASAQAS